MLWTKSKRAYWNLFEALTIFLVISLLFRQRRARLPLHSWNNVCSNWMRHGPLWYVSGALVRQPTTVALRRRGCCWVCSCNHYWAVICSRWTVKSAHACNCSKDEWGTVEAASSPVSTASIEATVSPMLTRQQSRHTICLIA